MVARTLNVVWMSHTGNHILNRSLPAETLGENIWIFSGSSFPAFRLNTGKYSVSLRIQFKCGEIRTRKTPNTGTFHAVKVIPSLQV